MESEDCLPLRKALSFFKSPQAFSATVSAAGGTLFDCLRSQTAGAGGGK